MRNIPALSTIALACLLCAPGAPVRAQWHVPDPADNIDRDCDRQCLQGFIDQYLQAMLDRDPYRLSVTKDLKFTENTVRLRLGDGLWNTLTGVGTYKLYFADTKAGQVGVFAAIEENGLPARISLRLKIEGRRISEVETVVIRKQNAPGGLLSNALAAVDPIWIRTVAPADRSSRSELIRIVNQYFEGVENATGDIVPVAHDAIRLENGVQTSPPPKSRMLVGSKAARETQGLSIVESFNLHTTSATHPVSPRRFLILDEERGLVFGCFMMQHTGNVRSYEAPGLGTVQVGEFYLWPSEGQIMEVFKVEKGQIVAIAAEFMLQTYKQSDGWTRPDADAW
jgi:hypothetical protein